MLYVQFRGLDRAIKAFRTLSQRSIPYAIRDTLNTCAFELRKTWQGELRQSFTLRNQYTERSIRVDRVQGLDVRSMLSRTGSIAPYMADQEEGATVRGKGKHKVIPAPAAAGQAPGANKRTRTVRQALRISAITVNQGSFGRYGRRRQNAIAIAIAQRKGNRFVLLNRSKGGRGIFEIRGGRRTLGLRLLYDLSRGSVRVPPQPTLQRAIARSGHLFQRAGERAFLKQLKLTKLFAT